MKHVFVSSTFKDMQHERDALHNFAALNINERLSPYGEEVYFGDLRWGVNTTSLDSDEGCRRVLEVCLDEIDDCRPYMIVLVGERYGWIPEGGLVRDAAAAKGAQISDEMSVTELEIEYGALLSGDAEGRVFFYFRELDTSGMSEELRRDYLAESELHRKKIDALKARIRRSYPDAVREYTARYDEASGKIVGLEGFLESVIADLSGAFLSDIEAEESLPWQERAIHNASRYYAELAKNYYPAQREPHSMLDGTFSHRRTCMRFIKGDSGVGKSAFLAHSYSEAEKSGDVALLPFVLGLDKYSTYEADYFKLLAYMLEEVTGEEHMECDFGEEYLDDEVIYRILALSAEAPAVVASFIDNCSYDLQNTLSVRILDRHFAAGDLDFFGREESYVSNLEFTVAYSADEEAVMLTPWFDFSRTYVLNTVSEEEEIPLIKMLLRQKHKELDGSVIAAIAEKEQATSPFYLKLAVDRMLMLDSADFAKIREMGDGMDNINRYQISVVKSLPDTAEGMARELIERTAERVGKDFTLRLLALLTYGAVRLTEGEIERVYLTRGWDFSSLEFALVTRGLSSLLSYNSKDKSYRIANPDVISALEELLDSKGYSYVARELVLHIAGEGKTHTRTMASALFRAASYAYPQGMAEFYKKQIDNERFLSKETAWLVHRHGAERVADMLVRLVLDSPECDFSFILREIPTACLTYDDREAYEEILQTILDKIEIKPDGEENINRNSFAAVAWSKLVSMKMKVNTSEASGLFHDFTRAGKREFVMTPRSRILLDVIYYRYLANEAFYSMKIISPECEVPESIDLLEELDSFEEKLLLSSHLFGSFAAYLKRAYEPSHEEFHSMAKQGYETLFGALSEGELNVTADDVATMIDSMLDESDDMLRADVESVSTALKIMAAGQTHVNSRLQKYLPRILAGAKYSLDTDESDFNAETVNLLLRLCATSRAVAGGAITIDDFLYAAVQMEHSYDILSEHIDGAEHYAIVNHLDRFVKMIINASEGDPRTFYRCYMSLRKLFSIFDIYELESAKNKLLSFLSGLEIEDADAPVLPELFIGSLIYRNSCPDNVDLRDRLRELLNTVDTDPDYALYKASYSPELMYLKLDIRTPEEIAADDEFMYSSGLKTAPCAEGDGDDEYSLDGDEDDGYYSREDVDDADSYLDDEDDFDLDDEDDDDFSLDDDDDDEFSLDDEDDDGDDDISDIEDMSIEDMMATLEKWGISIDELLSDDDEE
ncbi:MAG: DUF4062 domain-containing protein [Clostridia bacterium]|nr:DUF4062 domain-containing protein [Clostridia bacterium]